MIASILDSRSNAARITPAGNASSGITVCGGKCEQGVNADADAVARANTNAQASALSPGMLRALLLSGCALAAAIAVWYGMPETTFRVDRDLAFLLRGLALIKVSLVLAAVGVLWWRLGHAIERGAAAGYLAGAFLMSAGSGLIWQPTLVGLAALAFHIGGSMALLVAYFDRDAMRLTNRNSQVLP